MADNKFPAESFKETVLAPVFSEFKEHFFNELMQINYAHTIMLIENEVIKKEDGINIIQGLKKIEAEINLDEISYTGEFEDLYFYIENKLKEEIGIDAAGRMHTGRSRNDIDHTMYKMKLKQKMLSILKLKSELIESLIEKAENNLKTLVVAYTHGQPAQPTTYAHYLSAFIELLLRDGERFLQSYNFADHSSLGAAAITTSGFNIDRQRTAELLGFANVQENSYGAIAAVDYLTDVYSSLKILMYNTGRFSQDLIFWSSFEIGHLNLGRGFIQISSIMPQKRNPVALEHLRVMSSLAAGYCDSVINTTHNTPFTDMNDAEDAVQVVGFKGFDFAERVLKLLTDIIKSIKIDEEKVKKNIKESMVSITEFADRLVRQEDISFKQAHEIASEIVDYISSNSDIKYNIFREIFIKQIGREPNNSKDILNVIFEADEFINVRDVFGGPAKARMKESLKTYREKHKNLAKKIDEHQNLIKKSEKKLKRECNNIISQI
jgi:argininosuccinate lyase